MYRLLTLTLFLAPTLPAGAELRPKEELKYKKDGNDLIVSTTITVNGSDHILLTTFEINDSLIASPKYTVIQNSDRLVHSQKKLTIEWRITGERAKFKPTRVKGQVLLLSADELNQLGGKAAELTKDSELLPNKAVARTNELER
ncbi:MAG TPA: hypothetical protein VKD90_12220 [Gemmataceae bacterium]|nr:hypothetical protein [Gemmataceae bacterium]